MGCPSFSGIRQFTTEVKLASKCPFNFNAFCVKIHAKSRRKMVQKLCRILDQTLLSFETASEFILGGLGDLKIIIVAFPSLGDFVFGGETRTFLMTQNKSQKR